MHYVYLLQSVRDKGIYIECTEDLAKRFFEHNQKLSYHTRKFAPWKLLYYEAYTSKKDAYQREHSLKLHAQGLRRLKERLRNSLV